MTIYDAILKVLSFFGYGVTPPPDFEQHQKVVKNLERAVRITRISFPDGSTPPTGNMIEDMLGGNYDKDQT